MNMLLCQTLVLSKLCEPHIRTLSVATFSLDSSYMKGLRRKSYKETVGGTVGQNGANEESFLSWHHILFKKTQAKQSRKICHKTSQNNSSKASLHTHTHTCAAHVYIHTYMSPVDSLDFHLLQFDTVFSQASIKERKKVRMQILFNELKKKKLYEVPFFKKKSYFIAGNV